MRESLGFCLCVFGLRASIFEEQRERESRVLPAAFGFCSAYRDKDFKNPGERKREKYPMLLGFTIHHDAAQKWWLSV